MKLSPRVKALLLVALVGVLLYASLLGARLIGYSGGSFSGLGFALDKAIQERDATVVRLLLMTGADPNLLDQRSGMTLLDRAAERGNLKIARILLDAGADPDGSLQLFRRPLFHAAYRQDREMADLLLEHGAYYELVDAVLLSDTEFVEQALIEDPTVLQDMSYYGRSLLSMAMGYGRLDTARYLLELGLDPTGEGSGGQEGSVLDQARKSRREDFVELFESYQSVSKPESEIVENP